MIIFHKNIKHSSHEGGMTLVEIIIAVSILVVVMIAVAAFQFNVLDYSRHTEVTLGNIQDAQNILKYMSKEMRTMSPSANGSYPILSLGTSTITFYSDMNGDDIKEQIRYYIASTTLYRGITSPSGSPSIYNIVNEKKNIIAKGARNGTSTPLFEYFNSSYDGSGSALSYPIAINTVRLVRINLTIETDPNKSPLPITFSTQVSLRNLKDNQ